MSDILTPEQIAMIGFEAPYVRPDDADAAIQRLVETSLALHAQLATIAQWQPMNAPMPPDRQVLVCWSTGEIDAISVEEYMEIVGFGEPPALGWMLAPAPPAVHASATTGGK